MNNWNNFIDQLGSAVQKAWVGNESWRFIVSLTILILGFVLLEYLWRRINGYVQTILQKKELDPRVLNLQEFLPALRLAFLSFFLWASEVLLVLPEQLRRLFHGLEAIILAVALILLFFSLVNLLDRLRLALPPQIQSGIPIETLYTLKSVLRIVIIIGVAIAFISTQKALFPSWLWQTAWWRYLLTLAVLVGVYLVSRFIVKIISGMTSALKDSQEKVRFRLILQATTWPLCLLLATIALFTIKEIFQLPDAADHIVELTMGVLSTLALFLFIYRLLDVLEYELTKFAQREETPVDQTFVQMIRLFARVIVIVIGSIYLIRAISGKPLSALLAGLGIGGLAVALASQDTLKNFFGSIMIMLDKPFNVGQRVVVDGYDGTVETIGFRSTRVRTLTGHQVTIPNEKMASANVENIGRRPSIRRLSNITITYDTPPDKIEKALNIIREILQDHEGMDPEFPPRVFFNEFNDASLNILMVYWYFPPNYWDFLTFNERVNLQIMRAFEAEGIEFAFPTTTNYLAHDERRPLHITLDSFSTLSDRDPQ